MKGSMHRSDERARVASHDRAPPPAHPFPCSSLVKIAVPDLASVANKSVRFEAPSGGGHVREPGFDIAPGRAGERLYMRVTDQCQMVFLISARAVADRRRLSQNLEFSSA